MLDERSASCDNSIYVYYIKVKVLLDGQVIVVKRVLNGLTTLLVAAIVLIAAFLVVARITGSGVYAILSGSMEPEYPVGSLVYVRPVAIEELRTGDVITFAIAENMTVTHRIVDIQVDERNAAVRWFTTKGDANDSADVTPVRGENVVGSPVAIIPYMGYVITYLQRPPGRYIALAIVVLLTVLAFVPNKSSTKENHEGVDETR